MTLRRSSFFSKLLAIPATLASMALSVPCALAAHRDLTADQLGFRPAAEGIGMPNTRDTELFLKSSGARVGLISTVCDDPSRVEFWYFGENPDQDKDKKGRYPEGAQYSASISAGHAGVVRRLDALYSKDGVKGGFLRDTLSMDGLPTLDPASFCRGNRPSADMTMADAVRFYNQIGLKLDAHQAPFARKKSNKELKQENLENQPVDKSDPSKMRFRSQVDPQDPKRSTAFLDWDKSVGGSYTDRMIAGGMVDCRQPFSIVFEHSTRSTAETPDGFKPLSINLETKMNKAGREVTSISLTYTQGQNTMPKDMPLFDDLKNGPTRAMFCGPDGRARPMDLQDLSKWNTALTTIFNNYMQDRVPGLHHK